MLKGFRNQLYFNVGLAATAAVVLGLVNYLVTIDINNKITAIQTVRQEISFRLRATETFASLRKDADRARLQKALISSTLPLPDKLIDFPKDLAALAQQNGVQVAVSFGKEEASTEMSPGGIDFVLTVQGALTNWLKFLKALEKSRYLVRFDSFNVVNSPEGLQSVINGKVFSQ